MEEAIGLEMSYREAVVGDGPEIARLSGQLGYPAESEAITDRLDRILTWADNAVFVSEADDKLAGWVHVHGRYLIESPPFAEIGGLVVDDEYRGQGIGKELMRRVEEWARAAGFAEMRVRSGGSRAGAHRFYERIGYDNFKMQQVFRKRLDEGGD